MKNSTPARAVLLKEQSLKTFIVFCNYVNKQIKYEQITFEQGIKLISKYFKKEISSIYLK